MLNQARDGGPSNIMVHHSNIQEHGLQEHARTNGKPSEKRTPYNQPSAIEQKETDQIQPWPALGQAQKDTGETIRSKTRKPPRQKNREWLDARAARERYQSQHGNKQRHQKGWKRDLTAEGIEPNPGPPKKHGPPKPKNPKPKVPKKNKKGGVSKAMADGAASAVAAVQAVVDINKGAIPCKFGANCKKGIACHYLHEDVPEPTQNTTDNKMPPCRDYQKSAKCTYKGCKFFHDEALFEPPLIDDYIEPERNSVPAKLTEPVKPAKKENPPDWDSFRGLVALHFVAAGLGERRMSNAELKIRPWMTQSSIPTTHENVERAISIVHDEGVRHAYLLNSDQAFLFAKRNKYHNYRLNRDKEEGEASELWWFNPVRWYHGVCRGVRYWWNDLCDAFGGSEKPPIRPDYQSFPKIASYCPEEALEYWLKERGKTMDDLLNNRMDDILPEGCTIQIPSTVHLKCQEELPYPVGFTIESNGLWIPRKCWHSEALMILSRQLIGTNPKSTPESRRDVYVHGQKILRKMWGARTYTPLDKETQEEMYLNNKTSAQKKTYAGGKARLEAGMPVQYRKKCFPKVEVMTYKELHKRHPRNISGNDPDGTYLATVAADYYQYQKDMTKELFTPEDSIFRTRFLYTGGMRGDRVGELITVMEEEGLHPIEVDLSRCDAHCSQEARIAELQHYAEDDMPNSTLMHLVEDFNGRGVTGSGIKFQDGPAEGSGRPDTSYGTSIRIFFIWATYLHFHYWTGLTDEDLTSMNAAEKFIRFRELLNGPVPNPTIEAAEASVINGTDKVIQLGDDSVMGQRDKPSEDLINAVFEAAGHEPKTKAHDPSAYDDLTYCSSRFFRIGGGRRVLANMPFRTLHKTFISTDNALKESDMPGYIAGIARGYKHFYWLPVLGTIMQTIVNKADAAKIESKVSRTSVNPYKVTMTEDIEIDPMEVADYFYCVYGMDITTFSYVSSVDWMKTGVEWNLPFMRQGLQIDGLAKDEVDPQQAHF